MNRATYATLLAIFVIVYTILVTTMTRPPAMAEVLVAFIAIPRLHDLGRSGWWLLIFLAGEFLAVAIGWPAGAEGILIAGGLYMFLVLFGLIILAFVPGQRTFNRWGPPPPSGLSFRLGHQASESD